MAAAATARASAAPRTAPLRKPRSTRRAPASKARPRQAPRPRPRQAPGARLVRPAMAGAALFPQAAVRGVGAVRDFCRGWKNQSEVTVPGSHFIQEDSGPAIGRAVADWIKANKL